MIKRRTICVCLLCIIFAAHFCGCASVKKLFTPEAEPGEYTSCDFKRVRSLFIQNKFKDIVDLDTDISNSDMRKKNNVRCVYYLALSYLARSDYDNARRALMLLKKRRKAIEFTDQVDLKYCETYAAEGRYKFAVKALEKFTQKHPESDFLPSAQFSRARALQRLGRFEEAQQIFDSIASEYPLSFEAHTIQKSDISDIDSFGLQIEGFYDKGNAQAECERLRDDGYDVRLIVTKDENGLYHRVILGSFASRKDANKKRLELAEKEIDSFIYP